jgi:hypothetical protein
MNTLCRLLALTLFSLAASAASAAEPTATGASTTPTPPIPTLHCEIKAVMVCTPDGSCKPGTDAAGMTLPLKVTVDFENSVVAAADDSGFARTDKFDTVADSANQLMIHGIDGAFSWQLVLASQSEAASMTFASADSSLTGFGTCTNK